MSLDDDILDIDPVETKEWLDAVGSTLDFEGKDRTRFLLKRAVDHAHEHGADLPFDYFATELHRIFNPWLWHKGTDEETRSGTRKKLVTCFPASLRRAGSPSRGNLARSVADCVLEALGGG